MTFIVNPHFTGTSRQQCRNDSIASCPPYHRFLNGSRVASSDTAHFPYECYHYYCAPPGSGQPHTCDPYSNPNPQELQQILPCDEWSQWGFPALGQGWVGEPAMWSMDVGGMVNTHLYYWQTDRSSETIKRWVSVEIGPESFEADKYIEWQISQWDITVTANDSLHGPLRSSFSSGST